MKQYSVAFSPEAEEQLAELYRYIATAATPAIAERYTSAIVEYCADLKNFPAKGTARNDIRPGLRIANYRANAVIAFAVDDGLLTVTIVGVFYGGHDYEGILKDQGDD